MGNSFTTSPASSAGSMNVADARTWVRQFARNGGDSSMYPDDAIDRAIQATGNDFIARTLATRSSGDLALTAGSSDMPSFSGLTGFTPDRLLRAYLTGLPAALNNRCTTPVLAVTEFTDLLNSLTNHPAAGLPQFLAFDSLTTGSVYPTPDGSYTLRLLYSQPFTTWTPGDSGADSTTLNLPDDVMQPLLSFGATAFLQNNEPQNRYATQSWTKYLEFVERYKSRGGGTLGKQVSFKNRPRSPSAFRRHIEWMP